MIVTGEVFDEDTLEYLPGASVQVVDLQGRPLGPGDVVDEDGLFLIDSAKAVGNNILVTHIGYISSMAPASMYAGEDYAPFGMKVNPNYKELDEVVVTPKSNRKGVPWWLWVVGAYLIFKK